ncbi:MAG: hypothetical protein H6R26_351, partial [Proteobacteria bacterium]|nr:hypothetical protein [Pseudomonadota bacterium]
AFASPTQADNWHGDWWDSTEKHIFKEVDFPEKCVAVYDPITAGAPKLGDFCYAAHGTERVRDHHNRTVIKFEGGGTAKLWADGVTHDIPNLPIGTTHFQLETKTVMNKNDTIKTFKLDFESKPFQINADGECRRISVEMNFTGLNQIGGTETDPVFDITQGPDEIVVTPCSHSHHGFD